MSSGTTRAVGVGVQDATHGMIAIATIVHTRKNGIEKPVMIWYNKPVRQKTGQKTGRKTGQ